MSLFAARLAERTTGKSQRRWLFVPYDQLSDQLGPLLREDPRELGIVLVDSTWKARRRPYHRQKLALVMANVRHFALEQAERGVAVRVAPSKTPYRDALAELIRDLGPMRLMRPAERELRDDLRPLIERRLLEEIPHEGWLTTVEHFRQSQTGPPWRMDRFYAYVRRATGILMEAGKPAGGKFSHDLENRDPWHGLPPAAQPPRLEPDEITQEVGRLIEQLYPDHPGVLDLEALPATLDDAERLWRWAKCDCLPTFGPFEDAMSTLSTTIFHTRISGLVNLHRLLPDRVVREAAALDVPLASKEGFIRQVLGWREFVRHVHEATDGFRVTGTQEQPTQDKPGLGGYERWAGRPWQTSIGDDEPDGGALPNFHRARVPLPVAYWGVKSGLRCLDEVIASVWREGYSHHITRLMVLSNIATLLDIDPRELTDWFWVAYIDAYDWVVEPNVLGMGTYALGGLMTTKPYIAGAAYIDRMSDYCEHCQFDPAKTCPITPLYWAYLTRHGEKLAGNQRLAMPLRSAEKRTPAQRQRDAAVFDAVSNVLKAGRAVTLKDLPPAAPAKTSRQRGPGRAH